MSNPTAPRLTTADVVANVKAEMARTNLKAPALMTRLDMTRSALQRRLSGEIEFTATELATVADLLGVPVPSLLAPVDRAGAA